MDQDPNPAKKTKLDETVSQAAAAPSALQQVVASGPGNNPDPNNPDQLGVLPQPGPGLQPLGPSQPPAGTFHFQQRVVALHNLNMREATMSTVWHMCATYGRVTRVLFVHNGQAAVQAASDADAQKMIDNIDGEKFWGQVVVAFLAIATITVQAVPGASQHDNTQGNDTQEDDTQEDGTTSKPDESGNNAGTGQEV